MDVYDFDKTLYHGDSTFDFVRWCARRYPRVALRMPRCGLAAAACFRFHLIDKNRFKSIVYRILPCIPDIESELKRFWEAHDDLIQGPCTPKAGDLVISASPEFLLQDPCQKRGLVLIASLVDPHTGKLLSPNCSGTEKPRRFNEQFANTKIDNFYSDSRNDDPLAQCAEKAWLVHIEQQCIEPWPNV